MELLKLQIILPAIMNVILIQIVDSVYEDLASYLTDRENHRSISEYENNYIVKHYLFNFVSLVGPLICISFIFTVIGV